MSSAGLTDTALKQVFKEALGEAIRQGQQSDDVPRDAIMEILEHPS